MKRGWIFLLAFLVINLSFASAALMFIDDYETGSFAPAQNGYSDYPRSNSGDGVPVNVSNDLAYSGSYSLKANLSDGRWAELGYTFGEYLEEFWAEYYLHIPAEYFHNDGPSSDNNKFFLYWRDVYSGAAFGGFEADRQPGGEGKSYLRPGFTYNDSGVYETVRSDLGGRTGSTSTVADFIGNGSTMVPGNWYQIRVHIKSASGERAQDGIMQLFVDGAAIFNRTDLDFWFKQGSTPDDDPQPTFHNGYILGATNADFTGETIFHIDNLKFYNSDPGWGAAASSNPADLNTDDKVDF